MKSEDGCLSPEQLRLLAFGAPLCIYNGDFVDSIESTTDADTLKEMLEEWWEVTDPKSASETIAWLFNAGQHQDADPALAEIRKRGVNGISEEERNSLFHAKSGKSVGEGMHLLTKEQIERLLPVIDKSAWDLTAQKISSICAINSPAASEIQGKGSQVNVHYDSMITINGDVNDTKHFLKDMENVSKRISQNEVGKFAKELNDIARFGRY